MIESVKEYTYKCDVPRNSYILQYNEKQNTFCIPYLRTAPKSNHKNNSKSDRKITETTIYVYIGILFTLFDILNLIIIIIQFQNHILYLFQIVLNLIFFSL